VTLRTPSASGTLSDPRPLASISLDVDDMWSYMKTHGDPGWEARPSYYDVFFPMALEILDRVGLHLTFFIVGRDAAREESHALLRSVVDAGHEVGNHSFEHEPWLHLYDPRRLADDIGAAEVAIERATGQRPIGFRGPGYSWSPALLEVLAERGYVYDASTLPTFLGPLARAYYFWTAQLTPAQRAERKALFGTFRDGLRPIEPYRWELSSGRRLLEIPVTTMPGVRAPFHLSYLLYLSRFSEPLAIAYLRTALVLCRATGTSPSFLLHPLDLLGSDQAPALRFFPGMELPGSHKRRFFVRVLGVLAEHYRLVPMSVHAHAILGRPVAVHRVGLAAPRAAVAS
jgi:peptidoglycan/xylan/chitin deacetylase (PgdA/CDA1 family)